MKKLAVANWKMNPSTLRDALRLAGAYRVSSSITPIVCPPAEFLSRLVQSFGKKFAFGAQDCFWESAGPYTGETSPKSLRALGAQYVLLGHSERRKYLLESEAMINKKLKAALAAKLIPIVCLGGGIHSGAPVAVVKRVLKSQFVNSLWNARSSARLVLVFEPAYAISTLGGNRVGAKQALSMIDFIRGLAGEKFGSKVAARLKVLYGGSVDGVSASGFLSQKGIDGVLVGGASLRPNEFNHILRGA